MTSLDAHNTFSEICQTLVVNVHGAGLRSPITAPIGTPVRLETADHRTADAWVADFEPIGKDAKWWLVGITLEHPANFWGVPNPPGDWEGQFDSVAPPTTQSPERKFSVWPGAYGPGSSAEGPTLTLISSRSAPAAGSTGVPAARESSDPALFLSRLHADLKQRTEEQWNRLRNELEAPLLASARGLQQEIQDSLAAWRFERAAAESKLKELVTVHNELSTRLTSVTEMVSGQSPAPREEIIAEARQRLEQLISDFEEYLRAERRARESADQRLLESVEEQLRGKTDTLLQELRDRGGPEIIGLASGAMDRLERQLQEKLTLSGEKLLQSIVQELQERQQYASQTVAGYLEELRISEARLRDRVRQLMEDFSCQSEGVLAQLRIQVHELGEKQEQELTASMQELVATSEEALRAVQKRETEEHQQLAGQSPHSEVERLDHHVADLESRVTEVLQARDYVKSLVNMLPEMIQRHISEGIAAAVEHMRGPAQEQFTAHVRSEITALERRVHELQAMTSDREQQLRQLFAERQKEAIVLLQQRAAEAAAGLQEQLRSHFEKGRKLFEDAQASAILQLQALQDRADTLISLVDVELQKHAEDLLEETLAEAGQQLQASSDVARQAHREKTQTDISAKLEELKHDVDLLIVEATDTARAQLQSSADILYQDQLVRVQADVDRLLAPVVDQAAHAGSELLEALRHTKVESDAIRSQVEQAQALLARQAEQFQATLHDAFLRAAAEIKGRIHQAVEMAEEPIERHNREIQSQLAAVAHERGEELQKAIEEAHHRLEEFAKASETEAERALQQQLAQALHSFREDAAKLTERSMERWQAAIGETLAELPRLLIEKFGTEKR